MLRSTGNGVNMPEHRRKCERKVKSLAESEARCLVRERDCKFNINQLDVDYISCDAPFGAPGFDGI
jgi:hypothetical protein